MVAGLAIVIFLLGFLTGSAFAAVILYRKPAGTLRIDHSNPEKDIYRLEVEHMEDLSNHKQIVLDVDDNADLSQS